MRVPAVSIWRVGENRCEAHWEGALVPWYADARRCSPILYRSRLVLRGRPGERDPRTTSGYEGRQASSLWRQRPGETEFVTIGIGQVEVALAPLGIARGRR